jgi:YVTN family beta-propeller protein
MKTSKIRLQIPAGIRHRIRFMALGLMALTTAVYAENSVNRTAATSLPKNKVIATITATGATGPMVFSPNGDYLYVAGQSANTVLVIDTSTNEVTTTFSTTYPCGLAVSADNTTLYSSDFQSGTVTALNASTGAVITTIDIPGAEGLTLAAGSTNLYVTGASGINGTLSVVDTATNTVTGTPVSLPGYPDQILFSPSGANAYIVNYGSIGYVNGVVLSTGKVSTIGGGRLDSPQGIAISPNGDTLFLTDVVNYLAVLDALTGKLTKTVELAGSLTNAYSLYGLAITPSGAYLYAALWYDGTTPGNTVIMLNAATQKIVGSPITVGNGPTFISITPNGDYAYVINNTDGTISVIDITLQ